MLGETLSYVPPLYFSQTAPRPAMRARNDHIIGSEDPYPPAGSASRYRRCEDRMIHPVVRSSTIQYPGVSDHLTSGLYDPDRERSPTRSPVFGRPSASRDCGTALTKKSCYGTQIGDPPGTPMGTLSAQWPKGCRIQSIRRRFSLRSHTR
jgi:hypothetical protein